MQHWTHLSLWQHTFWLLSRCLHSLLYMPFSCSDIPQTPESDLWLTCFKFKVKFVSFVVVGSGQGDPHLESLPSADDQVFTLVEVRVMLDAILSWRLFHQVYWEHPEKEFCETRKREGESNLSMGLVFILMVDFSRSQLPSSSLLSVTGVTLSIPSSLLGSSGPGTKGSVLSSSGLGRQQGQTFRNHSLHGFSSWTLFPSGCSFSSSVSSPNPRVTVGNRPTAERSLRDRVSTGILTDDTSTQEKKKWTAQINFVMLIIELLI